MNSKAFVTLLVAVLILGGALGGAFAGGVALGKNGGEEAPQSNLPGTSSPPGGQQAQGQPDQGQLGLLRQRIQSGEISEEELAQLREQLQGQGGQAGQGGPGGPGGPGGLGGGGFAGRGGLTGTIESVGDGTLTINTPQGPLQATIGADTTIQVFAQGSVTDLETGVRVTVTGQRGDDGSVQAATIIVVPEGAEGFLGGGLPGGRGLPGRGQAGDAQ